MTATEVARNFSDVLNRVAAGEEIEIVRNGATVAVIAPPEAPVISAARARELFAAAPPVDPEFARDLAEIRGGVGPPDVPWRS